MTAVAHSIVIGIVTLLVPTGSEGILRFIVSCAPLLLLTAAIESWLFAKKL